ncbi:MAG TPA: hypothetical protein DGD08_00400 [Gemmatimonas aurantiaca]|nr:hypothetical protein [Gemmatimonas aurantiaca]
MECTVLLAHFGWQSLATRYDALLEAESARQVHHMPASSREPCVSESDIRHLPPPVAHYLHNAGVVGRPPVHNFVVEMTASLNRAPGQSWMRTPILQTSFVHDPARLFLMRTHIKGLPVVGLHAYTHEGASMQIRLFDCWPIVNTSGPALTRAETVTVLNDFCIMAPAVLIGPEFSWQTVNDNEARVAFTNGAHTVHATLSFDINGDLMDFVSDDRHVLETDGYRWSTPLGLYRDFGMARLASEGYALWHYQDRAPWCYGRFTIERVRYNVALDALPRASALRRP